jgi:septum formation inhibitor MinC
MYIREPLLPGNAITASSSVVVLGDVPQGASIETQGDVIIMGM